MAQRKAINEGDRVRFSYRHGYGEKLQHRTGQFVRLVSHDSKHWKDRMAQQRAIVKFGPPVGEASVDLLSLTKID